MDVREGLVRRLEERIVRGPGDLDATLRQAAARHDLDGLPAEARSYGEKVVRHAYKVVDGDVERMRSAGWSEDEVFELTVALALGAGLTRLDAATRALAEG